MNFQVITLTNFGQFKGTQTLDLRSDETNAVTLVLGAHRADKATLLSAFTWGLYGNMFSDVAHQQLMLTDSVWRVLSVGDATEIAVELAFDHEGQDYRLRRSVRPLKESGNHGEPPPSMLELWITRPDGSSEVSHAPQEAICGILPEAASRFCFFSGKRIENLVRKGASAEVQKDIKVLLDLDFVERAITHLANVNRTILAELESDTTGIARNPEKRLRASGTDEPIQKSRSRSALVQSVKRALEEILALREGDVRRLLDAEVKEIHKGITFKSCLPSLNEKLELTLHHNVNGVDQPYPKATSDNQILSLSLVAAVSKLARQIRMGRRGDGAAADDASNFPIVIDAAFGALDLDIKEGFRGHSQTWHRSW